MKIAFATAAAAALFMAAQVSAVPREASEETHKPTATSSSRPSSVTSPSNTDGFGVGDGRHNLRTFTNEDGYTLLIDEANAEVAGFLVGEKGVDGIYNANEAQPASGTQTWVDVKDGVNAVIDYGNPGHYTVYDSESSPIATVSQSLEDYSSAPTHYLMTFVNKEYKATVLIDQAITDAAILKAGKPVIDGIYTIPSGGVSAPPEVTGLQTWVDSADGYIAVIDGANPNAYTVYDESSSPIQTVSYQSHQ
ncbi:hypothetical protein GGF46_000150 [Coemansia sp. RSA 552]|nr:hypothetical protein GGF46_000150 [Coemansia sp. RSA 552]